MMIRGDKILEIHSYDLILFEDNTLGIVLDNLRGASYRRIYPGFNTHDGKIVSINRGGRMYVNEDLNGLNNKEKKHFKIKAICHNWWRRLTAMGIIDVVSSILMGYAHEDENVLNLIALTSVMKPYKPYEGDCPIWMDFPKEMTIAEIEEELGYPVKIIKEK